jgi:hypothetical protein
MPISLPSVLLRQIFLYCRSPEACIIYDAGRVELRRIGWRGPPTSLFLWGLQDGVIMQLYQIAHSPDTSCHAAMFARVDALMVASPHPTRDELIVSIMTNLKTNLGH